MQPNVSDRARVSHFLTFYLIHSIQVGVGILGFQRYIAQYAGYDAWISIIVTAALFHLIIWIMYKMLNKSKGDLVSIHRDLFGKWLGGLFSSLFIIYFIMQATSILQTFIIIIQVWLFPDMSTWHFALIYLSLVYYAVSFGFRGVGGVCFFGVVIPFYLIVTLIPPLYYGDFRHVLPMFTHSIQDIMAAVKQMTYSFLGIEVLLIFYPYLKNPEKSQKWSHYANLYTTFLYLLVAFSAFVYYSEAKLAHTIWATLTMWKIVSLPVLERFEVIGITTWVIVILPNICLLVWSASRVAKRISTIRQKTFLPLILVLMYIPICLIDDLEKIYKLTDITGRIGFYIVYAYIPLIACIYLIMKKVRKSA